MARNNNNVLRQFSRQVLKVIFGIIDIVFHKLFELVYGKKGKCMPPISDLLLLESATTIAYKIRTRKVSTLISIIRDFLECLSRLNFILAFGLL